MESMGLFYLDRIIGLQALMPREACRLGAQSFW